MPEKIAKYTWGAESRGIPFLEMLWETLKPFPGRAQLTLRIAISCTAIVLVSNTFRLPFQDLMPFLFLFVTKEEKVTTAVTAVLALLSVTVAIGVSIVLFKCTGNRAEFRIPGIAVEIFVGMYLFRVLSIGAVGWILAFIVSASQSLVYLFPDPEETVHQFSLALGCSRVLSRFGLGRQFFAISCVSNRVASAGIRGRLECYFRRNGTINRKFAFRRRKLASSFGQKWSDPFSQTFKTLLD